MKYVSLILAAASIAFSTTPTTAQTARPLSAISVASSVSPTPGYAIQPYAAAPGGWRPLASTVDESRARGAADVIRALGENDLNSSIAANNWEAARRASIENWAHQVRTKNQIRDEYMARERAVNPPLTSERHRQITQSGDPRRLSISQLSPSGIISWPSVLEVPELSEARSRLDVLFAQRARGLSATANADLTRQIEVTAIELSQRLAVNGHDVRVMEQVNAENFIKALRLEARQPAMDSATAGQVAARAGR